MEAGLGGAPGPVVISSVVADAPFALAPAQVLHLRTVGRSVRERRTRSSLATLNHVVSVTGLSR